MNHLPAPPEGAAHQVARFIEQIKKILRSTTLPKETLNMTKRVTVRVMKANRHVSRVGYVAIVYEIVRELLKKTSNWRDSENNLLQNVLLTKMKEQGLDERAGCARENFTRFRGVLDLMRSEDDQFFFCLRKLKQWYETDCVEELINKIYKVIFQTAQELVLREQRNERSARFEALKARVPRNLSPEAHVGQSLRRRRDDSPRQISEAGFPILRDSPETNVVPPENRKMNHEVRGARERPAANAEPVDLVQLPAQVPSPTPSEGSSPDFSRFPSPTYSPLSRTASPVPSPITASAPAASRSPSPTLAPHLSPAPSQAVSRATSQDPSPTASPAPIHIPKTRGRPRKRPRSKTPNGTQLPIAPSAPPRKRGRPRKNSQQPVQRPRILVTRVLSSLLRRSERLRELPDIRAARALKAAADAAAARSVPKRRVRLIGRRLPPAPKMKRGVGRPKKRKYRGRPKMIVDPPAAPAQAPIVPDPNAPPKRPRGRPRKYPVPIQVAQDLDVADQH